jgi:site-specific recombinase XerD
METQLRQDTAALDLVVSPRIAGTLDAYTAHLAGRKVRPRARDVYRREVGAFARALGDESTIAAVTETSITRYQDALGHLAASTIGKKLSAIRSWCRWCVRVGLRLDDPTMAIEWPKRPRKLPRALKSDELRQLEAALDRPLPILNLKRRRIAERNRRIVLLMLYCGLRRTEVAMLRWSDVDLDERVLFVRSEAAKGGIERTVGIHPRVAHELAQTPRPLRRGAVAGHKDGRCLSHKSIGKVFERWLDDLGLRIHAHRLRHTCATQMLAAGASLREIQQVLGHADIRTTEGYLAVSGEETRRAVERLPDRFV